MRTVLDLDSDNARNFFLKEDSYLNFELPSYFKFEPLLIEVSKLIGKKSLNECLESKSLKPSMLDDVNYCLYSNKNGKYDWRKFELIHPFLYVLLVNQITDKSNWGIIKSRFTEFSKNFVECVSIPVLGLGKFKSKARQINLWWVDVEQKSIQLSLKYQYLHTADISNYYPSIYTHSIDWSLRERDIAKNNKNDKSLGSNIDFLIREMNCGQTNGIPQGSVLMDFISEIVLGYSDKLLTQKIITEGYNPKEFKIIRYRDDYRIFSNNPRIGDDIIRLLTEVLLGLGLRLNSEKTSDFSSILMNSLKPDKLSWLVNYKISSTKLKNDSKIIETLQILHHFSIKYPNSGTLVKKLTEFYEFVRKKKYLSGNKKVMTAYVVDLAIKNPKTYPVCSAILSKIFSLINSKTLKNELIQDIYRKLTEVPNTGYSEIWLQRMTIKDNLNIFKEPICRLINKETVSLWNSSWLKKSLKEQFESIDIVDLENLESLSNLIDTSEISPFIYY